MSVILTVPFSHGEEYTMISCTFTSCDNFFPKFPSHWMHCHGLLLILPRAVLFPCNITPTNHNNIVIGGSFPLLLRDRLMAEQKSMEQRHKTTVNQSCFSVNVKNRHNFSIEINFNTSLSLSHTRKWITNKISDEIDLCGHLAYSQLPKQ